MIGPDFDGAGLLRFSADEHRGHDGASSRGEMGREERMQVAQVTAGRLRLDRGGAFGLLVSKQIELTGQRTAAVGPSARKPVQRVSTDVEEGTELVFGRHEVADIK